MKHSLTDFREGNIQQEPQFTDRLLARTQDGLNDLTFTHATMRTITINDHGPNSQERRSGADFAGFLKIDASDSRIRKLILVQAKLGTLENGMPSLGNLASAEQNRLLSQLNTMLNHTPESYLIVYTSSTVSLAPALSILETQKRNPGRDYWHDFTHYVAALPLPEFYQMYFNCLIGDYSVENRVGFAVENGNDVHRAIDFLNTPRGQLTELSFGTPLGSSPKSVETDAH